MTVPADNEVDADEPVVRGAVLGAARSAEGAGLSVVGHRFVSRSTIVIIYGKSRIASGNAEKFGNCFAEGGKVRYIVRMKKRKKNVPFAARRFAFRRDVWLRNLLCSDLPSGAKVVGARLSLYMNEGKKSAFPTHDKLGEECGLSGRQVRDHLQKLEGERWVLIKHVRNAGNHYWLRYWWDE